MVWMARIVLRRLGVKRREEREEEGGKGGKGRWKVDGRMCMGVVCQVHMLIHSFIYSFINETDAKGWNIMESTKYTWKIRIND